MQSRRKQWAGGDRSYLRSVSLRTICFTHADNSWLCRRPPVERKLYSCTVKAQLPAAEAGGRRGTVSRKGLEARSEHAGDADLEARSAIKDLPLCDPDLPRAAAPELHNALACVEVGHVAGMLTA